MVVVEVVAVAAVVVVVLVDGDCEASDSNH